MKRLSRIQQSRAPTRARTVVTLPGNSMSCSNGLAAIAVPRLEETPQFGEIQRHADDAELIEDVLQAFSRNVHPPFRQRARQTYNAGRKADTRQCKPLRKLGQPHRVGWGARGQPPAQLADDETGWLEPQRRSVDASIDLDMAQQRPAGQSQTRDSVGPDLTGQPRCRPLEQIVQQWRGDLERQLDRSSHSTGGAVGFICTLCSTAVA